MTSITSLVVKPSDPESDLREIEQDARRMGITGEFIKDTLIEIHPITRAYLTDRSPLGDVPKEWIEELSAVYRRKNFDYTDEELDSMSKEERNMIMRNALWHFESMMPYADAWGPKYRKNESITSLKRDLESIWKGRKVDSFEEFEFPMSEGGLRAQEFLDQFNQQMTASTSQYEAVYKWKDSRRKDQELERLKNVIVDQFGVIPYVTKEGKILYEGSRFSSPPGLSEAKSELRFRDEYKRMAFKLSRFARYVDADKFGDEFQAVFMKHSVLNDAGTRDYNNLVSDLVTEWDLGNDDPGIARQSHTFAEIYSSQPEARQKRLLALRENFWARVDSINANASDPMYGRLREHLVEVANLMKCVDSIVRDAVTEAEEKDEN